MYGIDLSVQIYNLMPALGLGFLLGAAYDCARILRLALWGGKALTFITDFLFVSLAALVSFLLFLGVNFGRLRGYLVIAEAVGFAVYRCTAGVIIFGVAEKICLRVKRLIVRILSPFRRIGAFFGKKLLITGKKAKNILKKTQNNLKKHLKHKDDMMYNNTN